MTRFPVHRPVMMCTSHVMAADHPLAAAVGASVLDNGGNAVDAAVAANLVLAVVRPHMCGLGGDLFGLIYRAESGNVRSLNASGRSPSWASAEQLRSRGLDAIPDTGLLAATVPGAVDGWAALLEAYGSMDLKHLIAPAIAYAEEGFPVYEELALAVEECREGLAQSPDAARIYLPDGRPPRVGARLRQPELAASLRMLADGGPSALYEGPIGKALVAWSESQGGWFTRDDLVSHRSEWVEPLATTFAGHRILTQPPNSQGLALLIQAGILERLDLAAMPPDSADRVHRMVEAKKRAFIDRDTHVADPAMHPAPLDELLSGAHLSRLAQDIDPQRASEIIGTSSRGRDTIFLAAADRHGNAVCLIQSIFAPFGSCAVIPGTGIVLQNRGRGFTMDEHHPNVLMPGKRPYHTLHCAMALADGKPELLLGSPGADGQPQTVMQLLGLTLAADLPPQAAVEFPRWRGLADGRLAIESRFPRETLDDLARRGHHLEIRPDWDPLMGSASIIRINRQDGVLTAGADPRRQAYAVGR